MGPKLPFWFVAVLLHGATRAATATSALLVRTQGAAVRSQRSGHLWRRDSTAAAKAEDRQIHFPGRAEEQGVEGDGLLCSISPPEQPGQGVDKLVQVYLQGGRRNVQFAKEQASEGSALCEATQCSLTDSDAAPVTDVGSCPDCPCKLVLGQDIQLSHQAMIDVVTKRCSGAGTKPIDVLMFGLGIGMTQSMSQALCPEGTLRFRTVELDTRMPSLASKYFGLALAPELSEVIVREASDFAREQAQAHQARQHLQPQLLGMTGYDIIFVDAFQGDGLTPQSVRTRRFLCDVRQLLKADGLVMHHMWHYSPSVAEVGADFNSTLALYGDVFGEANVATQAIPRPTNAWDSFIVSKASTAGGTCDDMGETL